VFAFLAERSVNSPKIFDFLVILTARDITGLN
jgi:hypothetical protein